MNTSAATQVGTVAHHHMSDRLAEANRMGELGRKEEVKRIQSVPLVIGQVCTRRQ